jgi:endonuclease YncB( thermonuclease family)
MKQPVFAGRLVVGLIACVLGACHHDADAPLVLKAGDQVVPKRLIKGDELVVSKDGKEARVRLVGIYAFSAVLPDPQVQALSAGAVAALEKLAGHEPVTLTLEEPPKDDSGRYLGYLDRNGEDLGLRMIEQGWAVVYTEFGFTREAPYLAAEQKARDATVNLWQLKPAAGLVPGLRKQWLSSRQSRGAATLSDPLLAPTP